MLYRYLQGPGRWQDTSTGRFAGETTVSDYLASIAGELAYDGSGTLRHQGRFVSWAAGALYEETQFFAPESVLAPPVEDIAPAIDWDSYLESDENEELDVIFRDIGLEELAEVAEEFQMYEGAGDAAELADAIEGRIVPLSPTEGWLVTGKYTITAEVEGKKGTITEYTYLIEKAIAYGVERPDVAIGKFLQDMITANGITTLTKNDGTSITGLGSLWGALRSNSHGGRIDLAEIHIEPWR